MVDEIFNGELKCYKLTDDECKLLRSKSNLKKIRPSRTKI